MYLMIQNGLSDTSLLYTSWFSSLFLTSLQFICLQGQFKCFRTVTKSCHAKFLLLCDTHGDTHAHPVKHCLGEIHCAILASTILQTNFALSVDRIVLYINLSYSLFFPSFFFTALTLPFKKRVYLKNVLLLVMSMTVILYRFVYSSRIHPISNTGIHLLGRHLYMVLGLSLYKFNNKNIWWKCQLQ